MLQLIDPDVVKKAVEVFEGETGAATWLVERDVG